MQARTHTNVTTYSVGGVSSFMDSAGRLQYVCIWMHPNVGCSSTAPSHLFGVAQAWVVLLVRSNGDVVRVHPKSRPKNCGYLSRSQSRHSGGQRWECSLHFLRLKTGVQLICVRAFEGCANFTKRWQLPFCSNREHIYLNKNT